MKNLKIKKSEYGKQSTHPKITEGIKQLLENKKGGVFFYGEFLLSVSFYENNSIPTAGVTTNNTNCLFFWNREFIDSLTQEEVNFLILHETFHLLLNHVERTRVTGNDHRISNIVQDMIINSTIHRDYVKTNIYSNDIMDKDTGKQMGWYMPEDYDGEWVYETLFEWFVDKMNSLDNEEESEGQGQGEGDGQGQGDGDGQGQGDGDGQGQSQGNDEFNGRSSKEDVENAMRSIKNGDELDNSKELDEHIQAVDDNGNKYDNNISEQVVKDIMKGIKARGLMPNEIEALLGSLSKPKKDWMRLIGRLVNNLKGEKVRRTYRKLHRKNDYAKGKITEKLGINVLVDVSGSMYGDFEKVLSQVNKGGYTINLIQCDTEIKKHEVLSDSKDIKKLKINGGGGTVMQPAFDYVKTHNKLKHFNTIFLTDGYTDTLDLSGLSKVLVLTTGVECPISVSSKSLKQVKITD